MFDILIAIDPHVYRLSAVKKAAYRIGDRCYAQIETVSDDLIQVRLKAKSETHSDQALEGEFRNELLDQELREAIAEETAGIRNLLLAQAFSGASLTASASDTADHRDDPLGIARSQTLEH